MLELVQIVNVVNANNCEIQFEEYLTESQLIQYRDLIKSLGLTKLKISTFSEGEYDCRIIVPIFVKDGVFYTPEIHNGVVCFDVN